MEKFKRGESHQVPIRPYARLLTMLSEQLISNERIALVELIKNCYDADSPWVTVSFNGIDGETDGAKQSIVIEDAGCGMTQEVVIDHWMNPATPEKKHKKDAGQGQTPSGRILQGEKGIGRFAIFKLAKKVTVVTRSEQSSDEIVIAYDFSEYGDEFANNENMFLDALRAKISVRKPEVFLERKVVLGVTSVSAPARGTRILLEQLRTTWTMDKIKSVGQDIAYMQPIFRDRANRRDYTDPKDGFTPFFYVDGKLCDIAAKYLDKLRLLLGNSSLIQITDGRFDAKKHQYTYKLNGNREQPLALYDERIVGQYLWNSHFGKDRAAVEAWKPSCGSFGFQFYVFDFSAGARGKYQLSREDKKIIKQHRVYLYRDGIRVYPYGDETDDWLSIDALRGTVSAGMFLSNNQVVGCVDISQKENPKLRDKTNREGLIEEDNAKADFILLLQLFLSFIRNEAFKKSIDIEKARKTIKAISRGEIEQKIKDASDAVRKGEKGRAEKAISDIGKLYSEQSDYMQRRVRLTEELAGVGMSVETASHDIMSMMSRVLQNLEGIMRDIEAGEEIERDELLRHLQSVYGGMSFIGRQLQDIQLLFTSSKQRRRLLPVRPLVDKVAAIYDRLLKKRKITLAIDQPRGTSPLMVKTTDAVILQLLINLFDNSVYWLNTIGEKNKQIRILLDGQEGVLVFSDNGPGVREEDKPYIFEPFFSGKGEDGRGLGLYIARQLLERQDYEIELADNSAYRRLKGANFVVSFVAREELPHE